MSSHNKTGPAPHDEWTGKEGQIREIKQELIAQGLYNGSLDDMTDKIAFYQAVREFQDKSGIRIEPEPDKAMPGINFNALDRIGLGKPVEVETIAPEETSSDETNDGDQERDDRMDTASDDEEDRPGYDLDKSQFPTLDAQSVRELYKQIRSRREDGKKHPSVLHTLESALHHSGGLPDSSSPGTKKKKKSHSGGTL